MRNRKQRLLVAGSVMVVLSVGTAGCGAAKTSTSASSAKTITWFVRTQPAENKWEHTMIQQYEHLHPNIRISLIVVPHSEFDTKLDALFASGNPPDLFNHWGVDGFADYYAKAMIQPLTPYLKRYHFNIHQIPANVLSFVKKKGQYYGIPVTTAPMFIVYNKTLFAEHHLPFPPTSWNDKAWNYATFMHDVKILTTNVNNPNKETWGFSPWGYSWQPSWAYSWLWNGEPFRAKGGRTNESAYQTGIIKHADAAVNPGVVTAMNWINGMIKKKEAPVPTQAVYSGATDPMMSGRIGMEGDIIAWLVLAKSVHPSFKWGIAPLPWMSSTQPAGPRFTDVWMLAKGAPHPNATFQFMEFISSGKGLNEYIQDTDRLPVIPSAQHLTWSVISKTPGFSMSVSGLKQVILGGIKHSHESPNHTLVNFPQWYKVWHEETQAIWDGSSGVIPALKKVDSAWRAMIQSRVQ